MRPNERLQEFDRIVSDLRHAATHTQILVEGPRDVRSLRRLGITGRIRTLHGPSGLLEAADTLAKETKALILLTDWDRTGGSLARTLRKNLEGRIRLDLDFRRRLARVSLVKCVEELAAFRDALSRRVGPA